jgi:hypothetical protein
MEGERFFDDLNETMLGNFSVAIRNSKWCTYGSLMTFGITVEVGNRSINALVRRNASPGVH